MLDCHTQATTGLDVKPFLPSEPRWYAVHTRSNFEKRVAAELSTKGFQVYLPSISETHRWKDRNKKLEVPVFPGYVFARLEACSLSRFRVLNTSGVVRILGSCGSIESIPDREIEAIQRLIAINPTLTRYPLLRQGARVRVRRGALEGVEGLLLRLKTNNRLVLSIELLCQSVATEVDVRDLEIIGAARGERN